MTEVEWGRLKASELNELAQRKAMVIVPVASTEQHGPHMPTCVDTVLATEVAMRAARSVRTMPVVVTPVVWTGLAEHHMSLGGTVSLHYSEFSALIRGVCRSIVRAGFARILLLNGHGGNVTALNVIVNDITPEFKIPIATATYWLLAEEAFGEILERQSNVRHACEAETSMMLAIKPDIVDMSKAENAVGPTSKEASQVIKPSAAYRWQSFKARTSHGAIGDPRVATAEKGERLLAAASSAVASLIEKDEFWTLPAE